MGGVDGAGSRAVNGRMSLGASYIYQNPDHPTVVTDVMIATIPRIYDDVASCPRGYERSCSWLPDIDGTDGFDTLSITPLRTPKSRPRLVSRCSATKRKRPHQDLSASKPMQHGP